MLCLIKLVAKALKTRVLPEVIFLRSYAQLLQLLIRAYPAYRRADFLKKATRLLRSNLRMSCKNLFKTVRL